MVFCLNRYILIVLLVISVISDIRLRKIPNKFTFPAMLWGIITAGIFNGLNGILYSLGGFIVGLAIFIIPYTMGGMGAGDVKLMATIGSLLGWKLTVYSALLTAVAGGIIVIGYTIYKGYFFRMLRNIVINIYRKILYLTYLSTHNDKIIIKYKKVIEVNSTYEKMYIPYAVAIAIGTMIVVIGNHLGYPPFI